MSEKFVPQHAYIYADLPPIPEEQASIDSSTETLEIMSDEKETIDGMIVIDILGE